MANKKLFVNILLCIFVIIFILISLELFLNLFPVFTFYYILPAGLLENAEAPLDFRLVPNFTGRMVGEYNVKININPDGLRDYEHGMKSNNFRILALGDSLAFGFGVDINDTFLSVIERQLNAEIIKAGVPAYGQDNELSYLITKGAKYKPDAVVIFYYLNDNDDNEGNTDRKVAYGNLIQKYRYESLSKWKLYVYTKLYTTSVMRLTRKAFSNIMDFFDGNSNTGLIEDKLFLKNQTKESKEWAKTAALFKELKKYSGNSAKLTIVYVPDKKQIYTKKFSGYFNSDMDVDKPNKVLRDIALSLNITYVDVTNDIRNLNDSNLYFKYDPHFNERGHFLFGSLVAEEIGKNIRK